MYVFEKLKIMNINSFLMYFPYKDCGWGMIDTGFAGTGHLIRLMRFTFLNTINTVHTHMVFQYYA